MSEEVRRILDVAVGVIERADGKILMGQRPEGKPWPGWWEFPGGKIEAGETVTEALTRELDEELGIRVTASLPWVVYVHAYPKNTVRLAFQRVTAWEGEPVGRENQQLQWVSRSDAHTLGDLLPASLPPLRWLALPLIYGVSAIGSPAGLAAFLPRLERALDRGLALLQLREPNWPDGPAAESLQAAMSQVLARCRARGAKLIINSVHPAAWYDQADGVHLRERDALAISARPALAQGAWVGVSAHTPASVAHAREIGADFAVVGSVAVTASHPGITPLGWDGLQHALKDAGLPVYAIGGMTPALLAEAREHGAHGVAVLSALWTDEAAQASGRLR